MKGTVIGPVVTPPESKAMLRKSGVRKRRQQKYQGVAAQQQPAQLEAREDAPHAQRQKQPDAHAHRYQQHHVVDVRHRLRQHLQIRLRHRDGKAHGES